MKQCFAISTSNIAMPQNVDGKAYFQEFQNEVARFLFLLGVVDIEQHPWTIRKINVSETGTAPDNAAPNTHQFLPQIENKGTR